MDSATLKAAIDTDITDKTVDLSIDNVDVGERVKDIVDYVDQQAPAKTSGSQTLSATPAVLAYDITSCSFGGGKAYLDATTTIGKEIYVIAASNNIEVKANVAATSKMFVTFGTFVASVTLTTNQMYRFTYIGFGSGAGGATDGYWKAELMN